MMRCFLLLALTLAVLRPAAGQDTTDYVQESSKMVRVILNDGTEKMGFLISDNEREVIIETANLGRVAIPKYQIKEVRIITGEQGSYDHSWADDPYQTRYFFTFNGLPRTPKKNYLKIFPLGIDAQFAPTENLQIGGFTSWVGAPIVGTIQGRFDLGRNLHGAVGGYIGTSSWVAFLQDSPGFVAIPYASLTVGHSSSNFMVGYGYGYAAIDGASGGTSIVMLSGTTPLGRKASFVFESVTGVVDGFVGGLITPGIRWHNKPGQAFQFGLLTGFANGEFSPLPIPSLSWYKTLD